MAHTPGPWVAPLSSTRMRGRRRYSLEQDPHYAHLWFGDLLLNDLVPDATQDANARLIAAAPQLLAACEAVFATVAYPAPEGGSWWRLTDKEVAQVRAAIAKAKQT